MTAEGLDQVCSELLELDAKEAPLKDRLSRANLDMQARRDLVGESHTISRRFDEDRRARGTERPRRLGTWSTA